MTLFDYALDFVLHHEGGYVNDPADPGGETIYGISRRAHPKAWEHGRPTKADAAVIYRRDYWDRIRGDELPPHVAVAVFDMAVNAGNSRAIRLMQQTVGALPDGAIGPRTIEACRNFKPEAFVANYATERVMYYSSLQTFGRFGKGWTRRTIECALYCRTFI